MNEHDTQKRKPLTEAECIDIAEIIARRSHEVEAFTKLCNESGLNPPEGVATALSREFSRLRSLVNRISEHQLSITSLHKP
jgi:hypothetical protein